MDDPVCVLLARRLAASHVADEHGRCQTCRSKWPCAIHRFARDVIRHDEDNRRARAAAGGGESPPAERGC